jgi:hypothetical protein
MLGGGGGVVTKRTIPTEFLHISDFIRRILSIRRFIEEL